MKNPCTGLGKKLGLHVIIPVVYVVIILTGLCYQL